MATYYVDIGLSSGGSGISTDPYGWDFVLANLNTTTTVIVRGTRNDPTANVTPSTRNLAFTMLCWDQTNPFRIKCNNFGKTGDGTNIVTGGIIECVTLLCNTSYAFGNLQLYNCYVKSSGDFNCSGSLGAAGTVSAVSGCTIVTHNIKNGTLTFKDSVIVGVPALGPDGGGNNYPKLTATNCALTATNTVGGTGWRTLTQTSCQFSWDTSGITWPSYDSDRSLFYPTNILKNVQTPPIPGNPPYTNYNKDLFGATRYTIGGISVIPVASKIRGKQFQGFSITKNLIHSNVAGKGLASDVDGSLKLVPKASTGVVVDTNGLSVDFIKDTPSGAIDGTNAEFTLSFTPVTASENVFLNGIFQEVGVSNDYTISGKTITFLNPPAVGSFIKAAYWVASRL
jgi:hypothetical protein